jgi:hypothetical protein
VIQERFEDKVQILKAAVVTLLYDTYTQRWKMFQVDAAKKKNIQNAR